MFFQPAPLNHLPFLGPFEPFLHTKQSFVFDSINQPKRESKGLSFHDSWVLNECLEEYCKKKKWILVKMGKSSKYSNVHNKTKANKIKSNLKWMEKWRRWKRKSGTEVVGSPSKFQRTAGCLWDYFETLLCILIWYWICIIFWIELLWLQCNVFWILCKEIWYCNLVAH